ncbi:MAG: hypothetical protein RMX97_32870 [Nostoc sp. DedQUE11]|nr:hypothetical protein [Nostoc sp. DedQUE11]
MFVRVLVNIKAPNNQPGSRQLHEFTRVPSVGEKIALPIQQGRTLHFVITDVLHLSLQHVRGGEPQAEIVVKPV